MEEHTLVNFFIGDPTSNTNSPKIIGGEVFTEKLDHTAGTLTASSAVIVDASSKIDVLNVDNITLRWKLYYIDRHKW